MQWLMASWDIEGMVFEAGAPASGGRAGRRLRRRGRRAACAFARPGRSPRTTWRSIAACVPKRLGDYLGQTKVKESLAILIAGGRRGAASVADHILFSGPPGLGKTTLATVVANELGATIRTTSGPAIARTGDLAAILTNLEEGDVLFIDEIHRLNRMVEEVLYPALEDFALDIVVGKGPAARSIRLDLPRFTLIGATTRTGLLTGPLRDRFGVAFRLQYYTPEELALHRAPLGLYPGRGHRRGGRAGDRPTQPRHPASGQPPAQARARLGPGARRRRHRPRTWPPQALTLLRGGPSGARRGGQPSSGGAVACSSAAVRWG